MRGNRPPKGEASARDAFVRVAIVTVMFALFASWSGLAFRGATLLETTESSLDLIQEAKIFFMVVLCLGSLLFSFLKGSFTSARARNGILVLAAALTAGGLACCGIDPEITANPFPSIEFGLALAGLGSALMTPFLGRVFSDIGPKATTASILVGYIVSALLSQAIWTLPTAARFVSTLVLPMIQVAVLAAYPAVRLAAPSGAIGSGAGKRLSPLPSGLLVVVLLSGFLGSFVRGAMYYSGADYEVIAAESLVLKLVVLAVLIIILAMFGRGYDTFSIFWPWVVLPVLISSVAIPFMGSAFPVAVSSFFTVTHNLCNAFNYTIFVDIASRYNRDTESVFCWGRAFDALGCIIGFALGFVFSIGSVVSAHLWYALSMVSSFAIVALFLLVLRSRRITDFEQLEVAEGTSPATANAQVDSYRKLAEEFSLTEREAEVLKQLDQGRSIPYISQELVISTSTAKTHVQSIYRKLDVHSRQELLDLIRNA